VESREDGVEKVDRFGVDGVMIGRGVFHDPWIFSSKYQVSSIKQNTEDGDRGTVLVRPGSPQVGIRQDGETSPPPSPKRRGSAHTKHERLETLRLHLDLWEQAYGKNRGFAPMKRFIKVYVNGFKGAARLRDEMMGMKTIDEIRGEINRLGVKSKE
jgi:tRNA-dihydrouridine synthase